MNILVVDDNEDIRSIIKDSLSELGVNVSEANSAEEAKTILDKKTFSAIISDWHMPNGDGSEVLKAAFRKAGQVFICTGDESVQKVAVQNGFGYIPKPFKEDVWESLVKTLLLRL